jgi:hypothetical protein
MGKRTGKPRGRPRGVKDPKAERKASLVADIDAEVQSARIQNDEVVVDEDTKVYATTSMLQAEGELFAELNADKEFERAAEAWREERRNLCFGAKYLYADPPFDDAKTVQIIVTAERTFRAMHNPLFGKSATRKRFTALDLVVAARAKSRKDGVGAPKKGQVKGEVDWREAEQELLDELELPGSPRFLETLRKKRAAPK